MKTTRLIITLALAAVATIGLSACATKPAAAPPPVVSKSTVDLMLEVRAKELELERIDKMSWLKFAAESGSDMVKGFVMGKSSAGAAGPGASSTTQTIMQAQAQADATALRREELAERYSFSNKAYQWVGLGLDFARFDKGLRFDKFQLRENNSQQRFLFNTVRGTQQDAYGFSGTVLEHGPYVLPAGATPAATTPAVE